MDWFVVVPLAWDSFDRERLLRLAIEGTVADESDSDEDEAFVQARRPMHRGYDRLDMG